MVKVSIGVTIYNVEEYLRECLDSIMNQTFKDFEVIMVDDGSTDNSFSICQEYVARDNRFKLIHQENKGRGQAGAKNTCLKHMTGEFVTWVDSDDIVDNNYLERLLEVQAETGADTVKCFRKYIRDGNIYFVRGYEDGINNVNGVAEFTKKDGLLNSLDNYLASVEFWGTLAPRKLYKGLVLSQGVIHEDQGNKFKLYFRSKKNVLLLDQLYSYRLRKGSIMDAKRGESTLSKDLYDLQVCTYNWDKLMYYVDIADYDVKEIHEAYMDKLDRIIPSEINLSEEDTEIYREAINRHKQKISRL